jgi:hypothetical protein
MGEGAVPRPMKRIWIPLLAGLPAILALLAPRSYAISPMPITGQNLTVQPSEAQNTPSVVQAYVISRAKELGVNPTDALWILSHESQDCQNLYGDDGESRGCWMISLVWHPEVPKTCAMDLTCSTQWSLGWIKSGNIDQWSTWACRYAWYPDATSTLGPAPIGYKEPEYCRPSAS